MISSTDTGWTSRIVAAGPNAPASVQREQQDERCRRDQVGKRRSRVLQVRPAVDGVADDEERRLDRDPPDGVADRELGQLVERRGHRQHEPRQRCDAAEKRHPEERFPEARPIGQPVE